MLSKKELSETLDLWRLRTQEEVAHIWKPSDERAFSQIRQLIEKSPKEDPITMLEDKPTSWMKYLSG